MSSPASSSAEERSAVSSVPLESSSTRLPRALASRTMSRICAWASGSPMPPKNTVSTLAGMVSMARWKVSMLMSPMASSRQLLRKHMLHCRLQRAVGSIYSRFMLSSDMASSLL